MLISLLRFFAFTTTRALLHGLFLIVSMPFRSRPSTTGVIFYEGDVVHSRNAPVKHYFTYPVKYILVDLPEESDGNGGGDAPIPSPYAVAQLEAGARMSAAECRALCGLSGTGRVRALLIPESAGYEQNPICVYYCYDDAGEEVVCCIAEVTNTPWGDRVAFPFAPTGDSLPKPLHVSPMQDMRSSWSLRAKPPAETLHVRVDVTSHPELGSFFVALLDARALPTVEDPHAWAFFAPHRVALWIYWHALVLLAYKGLTFFGHPKSSGDPVDYREPARKKAAQQGWKACPIISGAPSGGRPIVWTDTTVFPWN